MYYVDFSGSSPQIQKLTSVTLSYFPVISMDGRWVTYQTDVSSEGPSADSKKGKIWLRELAATGTPIKITDTGYVPRFVLNTPVDTPAIVYATSLECPQTTCYNAGQTLKKKLVNKVPSAAEIVCGGSYYGGLSWDNRFLCTGWPGGTNAYMFDLQNSAKGPAPIHTMRVKKTGTNVDTVVTVGTCNISRSASRIFTNTMLYFDFGSGAITAAKCYHPLLGTWKEHQKLFISNYNAQDLRVYSTPADRPLVPTKDAQGAGEAIGKEWNNPEWSNHPYYGAASLMIDRLWTVNGDYEHTLNTELLYLVNLKDSSYLKLIESTDTTYTSTVDFGNPFIWVEIPAGFQEDATWLSRTIWDRSEVRYTIKAQIPRGLPDAALADPELTGVTIYSLAGKRVASIRRAGNERIDLEASLRKLQAGCYFIGIEINGKQRYSMYKISTH